MVEPLHPTEGETFVITWTAADGYHWIPGPVVPVYKADGSLVLDAASLKFTGAGVTVTKAGTTAVIDIPGGGGGGAPSGPAGGDLGSSYPNPTVVSVANVTTGVLPAANQASQSMGGDVTGTTAAAVVVSATGNGSYFGISTNLVQFGSTVGNPTIGQLQRSGTGANAGATTFLEGQQGQNVSAGTNNNGGDVTLLGGFAGTGGSGGSVGNVNLGSGGSTWVTVRGSDGRLTAGNLGGSGVALVSADASGNLSRAASSVTSVSFTSYASRPAAGTAGNLWYPTAGNGHTPAIDDGSAWHPLVGGQIEGTQPDAAANWTIFNSTGSTMSITDSNGALLVVGYADGSSGGCRGWQQSLSGNTTITAAVALEPNIDNTSGHYIAIGVGMRESSSGKMYDCHISQQQINGQAAYIEYSAWSAATTRTTALAQAVGDSNGPVFIRVTLSGSNILAQFSRDLVDWQTLNTTAKTTAFTTAPDQLIITTQGFNSTPRGYVLSLSHS